MPRLLEINTPLGQENTYLLSVTAQEELGRLPVYNIAMAARKPGIKPAELLGKNVTFGLEMPGGRDVRYFNGYVTRFGDAGVRSAAYFREGGRGRAYVYNLVIHPWLWFLTRRSDCRIFQEKSIPDIIKEVFQAYPFAQFKDELTGSYSPWEYCCQYRESDFNFVSRLMEQEGIYYYFKHENAKHTLVLCDAPSAHKPFPGFSTIHFTETSSLHPTEDEFISEWHVHYEVEPGRYTLNDFDFTKPTGDLIAKAADPKSHDLNNFEHYDYPGEYTEAGEGRRYANIRLEEFGAEHEVHSGGGPTRGIAPGFTFTLQDHPQQGGEFLTTSASYSMINNRADSGEEGGAQFSCNFRVIPSQTTFRPARLSTKPIIQGPQTAIVVGPDGEEIYVDKHGRVKVQFHWDRYNDANEKSSCWVRPSQPWASKGWGGIFLPRIGHEVIIEFLEGDPDRPIITGRVYNGESTPPWALPENKTISGFKTRTYKGSSSNFNELRFDDKKGAEEVYIHAEKDKNTRIKNTRREFVGNESHRIIKNNYQEQIKEGEHHLTIKGDENEKIEDGSFSLDVANDWQGKMGGKMLLETGAEIHQKAGASIFFKAADNICTQAGKKYLLASKDDMSVVSKMNMAHEGKMNVYIKAGMSLVIEAGISLTLKVGGNFINIGPAGVAISGSMVQINSGGAAGSGSAGDSPSDGTPCMPTEPKKPEEAHGSQGGTDMKARKPAKPESYSPQAAAMQLAWEAAAPCTASSAGGGRGGGDRSGNGN